MGVRGYCKIRLILCNSLFYASSSLSVIIQMGKHPIKYTIKMAVSPFKVSSHL